MKLLLLVFAFAHADAALTAARVAQKPAMIVFAAEWCAACRVLDRSALADPAVAGEARRFVTAKIDVTNDDREAKRFAVTALPTILFVDSRGSETRVVGTIDAPALVAAMRLVR
jgi:thiol:disulfide interchange protein DsbD